MTLRDGGNHGYTNFIIVLFFFYCLFSCRLSLLFNSPFDLLQL